MIKLIGSLNEQNIREQLIKSNRALFNNPDNLRLLNVLKENFPEMRTAYILGHIPEQGEDIYQLLINSNIIANVELNRDDISSKSIIESKPIETCIKGLKKIDQIKLAVALDLTQKNIDVSKLVT